MAIGSFLVLFDPCFSTLQLVRLYLPSKPIVHKINGPDGVYKSLSATTVPMFSPRWDMGNIDAINHVNENAKSVSFSLLPKYALAECKNANA